MAIPSIDVRTFDVDDIIICLENEGYTINQKDFDFARDGAFKYNGYSNGKPRYLIGFESDSSEEEYYATRVYIGFSPSGCIAAEYAVCPTMTGTHNSVLEYIQGTCN